MKISFRDTESFVKKPDPKARVVLVYGPDDGLMRERARAVAVTVVADINDPFNSALLSADTLADDPARLFDEANALSLMGGRRLVRVENGRDAIAPLLRDYLKNPNGNAVIVIEAGELGPKSPLRILCEKADNAAALPCYVEDERGAAGVIRDMLRGYSISPDALAWMAGHAAGDRRRLRSEAEKLMVYMGEGNRSIGIDDAQAVCGDAGILDMEGVVHGTAGGDAAAAFRSYSHLLGEGVPVVSILRALQAHFRRLHLTRARMENGEGAELAMKSLNPPVFFKQADAFRAQLNRWSLPALEKALVRLAALEAQCKQTNAPDETLCAQALLALSAGRAGGS